MRIKKGFAKRKIGNRFIVVATGELSKEMNVVIEMNDTSSDIWDYIEQGKSIDEIALALSEKYGIANDKAKADVENLTRQMRETGIFED